MVKIDVYLVVIMMYNSCVLLNYIYFFFLQKSKFNNYFNNYYPVGDGVTFLSFVQIQQAIQQNLLPSLSMDPCWVEGLRCLLVAPFWFMRRSKVNSELLLEYVRGILKLTEHDRKVLGE